MSVSFGNFWGLLEDDCEDKVIQARLRAEAVEKRLALVEDQKAFDEQQLEVTHNKLLACASERGDLARQNSILKEQVRIASALTKEEELEPEKTPKHWVLRPPPPPAILTVNGL